MPERGEVWIADLNPRSGTEAGRARPVLIVQARALLDAGHPATLVTPLTQVAGRRMARVGEALLEVLDLAKG